MADSSLSAELTSVVLLGIGCAANPWGIMIAVLLLDARRGHGIVWAYVVAWVGAISVVLTALLAGFAATFESGSDGATTAAAVVELIVGLGLLGLGLRGCSGRAAPPEPPSTRVRRRPRSYRAGFVRLRTSPTSPPFCSGSTRPPTRW